MRDFFMKHELKPGPAPPETWLENVLQRVSNAGPEKIVLIIETDIYSSKSPIIKKIKKLGKVIELGKTQGRGKEREQAVKFIKEYLREEKKEIAWDAVQFLLENTGEGDLVSLKTELDKLIQLTGERPLINRQDVEEVSSRHREEEIFRITDAISRKETKNALSSLHLLLLQGVHPIAVFSTMVTFLRRMLALKVICDKENMDPHDFHVSYQAFQRDFFPKLKQDSMHPYPLYKMFQHSSRFDKNELIDIFLSLPEVDMELKGGGAQADMVLERLIFQITVKNYDKH
jgi:DNA polymerase-3 subunit delta